jgi:hypothetical protein
VRYNKVGTNKWTTVSNVGSTSHTLTNLQAGKTYQWKVKSSCNATYSLVSTFVTPNAFMLNADGVPQLELYPNPAKDLVIIKLNGWDTDETGVAELYSITGAFVKRVSMSTANNAIGVSELAAGMYVINVISENKLPSVLQFVKQ